MAAVQIIFREQVAHGPRGCAVINEQVDESSMSHCVRQVMAVMRSAQRYAILQPTSPIRQLRLLIKIIEMEHDCFYTVQRIKIVGNLEGELVVQCRRQDATRWLHQHDGSILTGTRDMAEAGLLFSPDAVAILQQAPYTMQIDSFGDLTLMRGIYDHFDYR